MNNLGHGHERRAEQRSRCLKGARIVLANGNSTLACRVRSQSDAGLRLSADETSIVADRFILVRDGSTRSHVCEVAWRGQGELGARILAKATVDHVGYSNGVAPLRPANQQVVDRYPV